MLTADLFYNTKVSETKSWGYGPTGCILPKVIGWRREGKSPIGNFIKFFLAKNVLHALHDMESQAVIKPVLI